MTNSAEMKINRKKLETLNYHQILYFKNLRQERRDIFQHCTANYSSDKAEIYIEGNAPTM